MKGISERNHAFHWEIEVYFYVIVLFGSLSSIFEYFISQNIVYSYV